MPKPRWRAVGRYKIRGRMEWGKLVHYYYERIQLRKYTPLPSWSLGWQTWVRRIPRFGWVWLMRKMRAHLSPATSMYTFHGGPARDSRYLSIGFRANQTEIEVKIVYKCFQREGWMTLLAHPRAVLCARSHFCQVRFRRAWWHNLNGIKYPVINH